MSDESALFNPYPGLRPFEPDENYLFFGRDGQSNELLRRLRRNRFLAVVGTSGSGKSSLVRAGWLPDLQSGMLSGASSRWRIAIMRPGGDPIGNLAGALCRPGVLLDENAISDDLSLDVAFTKVTLQRSTLGIVEAVRQARVSTGANVLIVVDQFEELFRFRAAGMAEDAANHAAAFVKLLLTAARQPEMPLYVIITMRSDFLGDCAQFRDLPEAINDGQYLIPRMTRDERREAITGPAAVGGGHVSPRLLQRLLNDVGDNPDQLPILQHALMRTWDHWQANRADGAPIDLPDYETIGGMAHALSHHADEAYAELAKGESEASAEHRQWLAERLFKCLTEKGADNREIRHPTRLEDIANVVDAARQEVTGVIDVFRMPGRSFLMPPAGEPLVEDTLIDISHESLIRNWKRLKKWVDEEAGSATTYRRLADTAQLHKEGKAGYYRNPELQIAKEWQERERPNASWANRYRPAFSDGISFLANSLQADWRRRLQMWGSVFAVIVVLLITGGVLYNFDQNKATHGFKDFPGDLEQVAEVLKAKSTNPDLRSALCLAIGGLGLDAVQPTGAVLEKLYGEAPDPGTHSAARWALQQQGADETKLALSHEKFPEAAARQWYVNQAGMTMLKIPADEQDGRDSFWLAATEVSVQLFLEFIEDTDEDTDFEGDKPKNWEGADRTISPSPEHPVQQVSWIDSVMFCNWLSTVRTISVRFGRSESRQDFRNCSVAETLGEFRYDIK